MFEDGRLLGEKMLTRDTRQKKRASVTEKSLAGFWPQVVGRSWTDSWFGRNNKTHIICFFSTVACTCKLQQVQTSMREDLSCSSCFFLLNRSSGEHRTCSAANIFNYIHLSLQIRLKSLIRFLVHPGVII